MLYFMYVDMNVLFCFVVVFVVVVLFVMFVFVQDDILLQVLYCQVLIEYFKDVLIVLKKYDGYCFVFMGQVYLLFDDSLNMLVVIEDLKVGVLFQDDQ